MKTLGTFTILSLKLRTNEQNTSILQGLLQRAHGESDLAKLATTSTINDDCFGCNIGNHCDRLGIGPWK
jgi:hypothetical protein